VNRRLERRLKQLDSSKPEQFRSCANNDVGPLCLAASAIANTCRFTPRVQSLSLRLELSGPLASAHRGNGWGVQGPATTSNAPVFDADVSVTRIRGV